MSNYTPSTDFASKDSLLSGDPAKVVKGTEFSTEFSAIQAAVATKADANSSDAFQAGATTLGATSVTALTDSGNLTFSGTGNRITGDFSNATVASRVMFQTSTVNGSSIISTIPNGTGNAGAFVAYSAVDPANASYSVVGNNTVESYLRSEKAGTGTYLPMTFYTSGAEKLRIAADATGTYTFGGTAPRITGDFSNATVANRVMFQTSTVNGSSIVGAIPNGTGNLSGFLAHAGTDTANTSVASLIARLDTSEARFTSGATGTGSYLPMTFYTGGSERVRIDTSGNVGVGVSPNANWGSGFKALEIGYSGTSLSVNASNGNAAIRGNLYVNASSQPIYANTGFASVLQALPSTGSVQLSTFPSASAGSVASAASATFQVTQNNCEMITANGGLGYGTGAGGTVTQATSKSTTVTLNKPTGQITMNNAALAAGAEVIFLVNNSVCAATDTVIATFNGPYAGAKKYDITVLGGFSGSFAINVKNTTAGSLSEAVVINFAIIKGATA